jgi:CheY-like chemotaxis protein
MLAAASPPRRGSKPRTREVGDHHRASAAAERRLFLIEDNPGDVDLVRQALSALPYPVRVVAAGDGNEAIAELRQAAQRGSVPDVIFLDLNLPGLSGHAVLAWLKSDPSLRDVPVVVLTSSSAKNDNDRSYELGANDFVTKPLDVYNYFSALQATARLWFESPGVAKRPPRG